MNKLDTKAIIEAAERLSPVDREELESIAGDLDYAAMPTKPDVVSLCGPRAGVVRDAIRLALANPQSVKQMAEIVEAAGRAVRAEAACLKDDADSWDAGAMNELTAAMRDLRTLLSPTTGDDNE